MTTEPPAMTATEDAVERAAWALCPYMADEYDPGKPLPECEKCPALDPFGKGTRGCRHFAEMAIRAVFAELGIDQ